MIESKDKKIDDLNVTVTQFGARRGLKLKVKLLKIFGPALVKMVEGLDLGSDKKFTLENDVDLDKLGDGVKLLFERVDEDQTLALVEEILADTKISTPDGKITSEDIAKVFDMVFSGNYLTMYKVVGFALEVNYGSFFGEGGIGKIAKLRQAIK